jgi:hypothetical protein
MGFAGSRRLFAREPSDPTVARAWRDAVEEHLTHALGELPQKLALGPGHFLCGISQIACGADTVFVRACNTKGIPVRLFLPQQIEEFLAAEGSAGPDFTPEQRKEARELLQSESIIQQRVVAHSPDRQRRFREANAEIARVSDVVVCIVRKDEDNGGEPGGTLELLERAKAAGLPALEITVATDDEGPRCEGHWHNLAKHAPVQLPEALTSLNPRLEAQIPPATDLIAALKRWGSTTSHEHQRSFKNAAKWILGTHILATLLATLAVALHGPLGDSLTAEGIIFAVLLFELGVLLIGFGVHRKLHHSHAAGIWAHARLVAELARSMNAVAEVHIYPEQLFRLPLPRNLRPLLRTISTLHLRSTYAGRDQPWHDRRDEYVSNRVDHQKSYYDKELTKAEKYLSICQSVFQVFSVLAILATLTKLGLLVYIMIAHGKVPLASEMLGTLAIVFPVLAVAGLSWAAALDYEARAETYRETRNFLDRNHGAFERADTPEEFERLVVETESVLLGEVSNWFSRRASTGVT